MSRWKRNPKITDLAKAILNPYQPKTVEDMQDALKDIFDSLFEKIIKMYM
jgi:hypothetical protein